MKGEAWAPSYPKSQILTEDSLLSQISPQKHFLPSDEGGIH